MNTHPKARLRVNLIENDREKSDRISTRRPLNYSRRDVQARWQASCIDLTPNREKRSRAELQISSLWRRMGKR